MTISLENCLFCAHLPKKHKFETRVKAILLTFGGTDQHNLSSIIYHAIRDICKQSNIIINIVTGYGYEGYEKLNKEVKNESYVTLTKSTGVISSIMERSQIAITSNGRTVYELAHMNIPAIVISQHEREETHEFARSEYGFIPINTFKQGKSEVGIVNELSKLLDDEAYRRY